jgi:hypothetical protein
MEDLELMSLAEAAAELGIEPVSLRSAIKRGRFQARLFGKTYVTTRTEVERYRRDNLGKGGAARARLLATIPWQQNVWAEELRIIGFETTPTDEIEVVKGVAAMAIAYGAMSVTEVMQALKSDPRTKDLILSSGERPPYVGIAQIVPKTDPELLRDEERTMTNQTIAKPTRQPGD